MVRANSVGSSYIPAGYVEIRGMRRTLSAERTPQENDHGVGSTHTSRLVA
jgi:hypothetical protein